jgi:hypothetical protein
MDRGTFEGPRAARCELDTVSVTVGCRALERNGIEKAAVMIDRETVPMQEDDIVKARTLRCVVRKHTRE